jgi:glycopeptide antibiotics resistance protein
MTTSAYKLQRRSALTTVLFIIYAFLLVSLILFKFPFSYQASESGRVLNLIPFAGSFTKNGEFRYGEVVENVLVFVPLGVYICMLKRHWSFARKLVPIIATTVAFESIQYIFAIGRADITDVLGNTLGGVIGIGIYAVLNQVLGTRTNRVLNTVGLVLTVCALVLVAVLLVKTLHGR